MVFSLYIPRVLSQLCCIYVCAGVVPCALAASGSSFGTYKVGGIPPSRASSMKAMWHSRTSVCCLKSAWRRQRIPGLTSLISDTAANGAINLLVMLVYSLGESVDAPKHLRLTLLVPVTAANRAVSLSAMLVYLLEECMDAPEHFKAGIAGVNCCSKQGSGSVSNAGLPMHEKKVNMQQNLAADIAAAMTAVHQAVGAPAMAATACQCTPRHAVG